MKTPLFLTTVCALAISGAAHAQDAPRDPFERYDLNSDGQITLAETQEVRSGIFDQADQNGDGFISEDERSDLRAPGRQQRRQRPGRSRNEGALDTNEDGMISREEFLNGPNPLFDRVDANEDGVVTQDEIDAMRSRRGGRQRSERPN